MIPVWLQSYRYLWEKDWKEIYQNGNMAISGEFLFHSFFKIYLFICFWLC